MPEMTNRYPLPPQPEKPLPIRSLEQVFEPCILCGAETLDNSCKVKCLNCGYTRDCSDP